MANPFFTDRELAERERVRDLGVEQVQYSVPWLKAQSRPLYLFGAGRNTAEHLGGLFANVRFAGIMDNNPALWGQTRHGLPVHSPAGIRARADNPIVIVSQNLEPALSAVKSQCREMGFEYVDWLDCQLRSDPVRYRENVEARPEVVAGLDIWADAESREVYRSMVRFRAAFDSGYLAPPSPGPQYFQNFIPAACYRSFVDVGAFDGDTLREFLALVGGDFDLYRAFEPAPDRVANLAAAFVNDPRVRVVAMAVASNSGTAKFRTAWDGSSALDQNGDAEVRLTTLDEELDNTRATCIKMDVEGAEPEALRGGEAIIRAQRPALMICVYHEPEHLWEIPLWIKTLCLGYELRLRHHSPRIHETVCYAVPPGKRP